MSDATVVDPTVDVNVASAEPVLTHAAIQSSIATIASISTALGVPFPETYQKWVVVSLGMALAAAHILGSFYLRKKVTPVVAPKNDSGQSLTPDTTDGGKS